MIIHSLVDLGEIIQKTRKKLKITQEELASLLGVSHVSIKHLEHGNESVKIGLVFRAMDELGITCSISVPKLMAEQETKGSK